MGDNGLTKNMINPPLQNPPAESFGPAAPVVPLPAPAAHRPMHTRRVVYESYIRDDKLFDLEGRLVDTKAYAYHEPYRGVRAAGDTLHEMVVRLTIGIDMVVREIHVSMPATPYPPCGQAQLNFAGLVGLSLARGWRKALDEKVGAVLGCTHVREMLAHMPTIGYQTLSGWSLRSAEGMQDVPLRAEGQPRFIDGCRGWASDGPVVAVLMPEHFRPRASEPDA